jgi:hypothetical protein
VSIGGRPAPDPARHPGAALAGARGGRAARALPVAPPVGPGGIAGLRRLELFLDALYGWSGTTPDAAAAGPSIRRLSRAGRLLVHLAEAPAGDGGATGRG